MYRSVSRSVVPRGRCETVVSQREDIHIPSDGEQLAAYLYRPAAADRDMPCVVMAHGFSGTRDDGLPAYAEAFCAAGYAVVLFDYRHFGASSGQPRQLLDIERQIADYRAVVQWARQLDGVDPDRIVLWGTSFSGGHVLEVAATDPRIAAVIAQVPFTDGVATLMWAPLKNVVHLGGRGPAGSGRRLARPSAPSRASRRRPRHSCSDNRTRRQTGGRGAWSAGIVVAQ